jgi:hypothetical protein
MMEIKLPRLQALSEGAAKVVAEAADEPSREEVRSLLKKIHSDLDHTSSAKSYEVKPHSKTVDWISQDTNLSGSKSLAQEISAKFKDEGWRGWTIRVIGSRHYDPKTKQPNKAFPWSTAVS